MTRGEIYRIRLPAQHDREQSGARFAVIVQADEFLGLSTAIVAPTSRGARPATFRPTIELEGQPTQVMLEQLRAVDIERLERPFGRLTAQEQSAVDDALTEILDLN